MLPSRVHSHGHSQGARSPEAAPLCQNTNGERCSLQGEKFSLRSPVTVAGPVEAWMLAVEKEMCVTLHAATKEGVHDYPAKPRARWIDTSLGMVGLVGA